MGQGASGTDQELEHDGTPGPRARITHMHDIVVQDGWESARSTPLPSFAESIGISGAGPNRPLPLHGGNDAKGVERGRSLRAITRTVVALPAAARPRDVIYLCLGTSVRDQRHSAIHLC